MAMLTALLMMTAQAAPVIIQCPVVQPLPSSRSIGRVLEPAPVAKGSERETLVEAQSRIPAAAPRTRLPRADTELTPNDVQPVRTRGLGEQVKQPPSKEPEFVGELVDEAFAATVESSKRQAEDYAQMVEETEKSVDAFVDANTRRPSNAVPLNRDPRCK